jgi:hypothetical protein
MLDDPFIYGPDGFPISVKPAPVAPVVEHDLEPAPPPPTPFQLAQRGSGAALLAVGGAILILEHFTHGLQTPQSVLALTLVVLGVGLTLQSLPTRIRASE